MMDLLTVPGQYHYILALQHAWGLYFPISLENLIKLKRVPNKVNHCLDWIIGCYSGIKGSHTGRGMYLFREEEAGLLGTLKKEISCLLWSPQNPLGFISSCNLGFWWVLQTEIGVCSFPLNVMSYLSLDTGVKAASYGLWLILCQHFLCHSHFQTLTGHIPFFQLQHCCLKSI